VGQDYALAFPRGLLASCFRPSLDHLAFAALLAALQRDPVYQSSGEPATIAVIDGRRREPKRGISMDLKVGMMIWLPCEVKPGPFSDERAVRVTDGDRVWVGFVGIRHLRTPETTGKTWIRGVVAAVENDRFSVRLPGHSVTSPVFQGERGGLQLDPIPA